MGICRKVLRLRVGNAMARASLKNTVIREFLVELLINYADRADVFSPKKELMKDFAWDENIAEMEAVEKKLLLVSGIFPARLKEIVDKQMSVACCLKAAKVLSRKLSILAPDSIWPDISANFEKVMKTLIFFREEMGLPKLDIITGSELVLYFKDPLTGAKK